jgi:hypothetical protein
MGALLTECVSLSVSVLFATLLLVQRVLAFLTLFPTPPTDASRLRVRERRSSCPPPTHRIGRRRRKYDATRAYLVRSLDLLAVLIVGRAETGAGQLPVGLPEVGSDLGNSERKAALTTHKERRTRLRTSHREIARRAQPTSHLLHGSQP